MRSLINLVSAPLCALVLVGCATAGAELQATAKQEYAQLSVEHFMSSMKVKDDELERSAQFSTFEGNRTIIPLDPYLALLASSTKGYKNDEFIRAYVFKETGKEIYQMYFIIKGYGWSRPNSINFTAGLGSKLTSRIGIDVKCNASYCNHDEDVVVDFTRAELENVIRTLEGNSENLLKFRIKGQSGKDYDGSFSVNEIKAVLQAVEKYKIKS